MYTLDYHLFVIVIAIEIELDNVCSLVDCDLNCIIRIDEFLTRFVEQIFVALCVSWVLVQIVHLLYP